MSAAGAPAIAPQAVDRGVLVDTHCHLDAAEFDADRERVIGDARAAGVRWIVVPSVDAAGFDAAAAIAHAHDGCAYALGIHPMFTDRAEAGDLERLRARVAAAIEDPRLVAIGEIGLDHFVPELDRERQAWFFVEQLKIAREFGLPVLMHVRRAQDAVLRELRRVRPPGGIAHAFNGSEQQAGAFLDLGCALGFGGAFTYERALQLRRLVTALPAHAHVLETDAPDIPPAWRHRQRNTPAELARIAAEFAVLRGGTAGDAARQTAGNAFRVLPRLAALAGEGAH